MPAFSDAMVTDPRFAEVALIDLSSKVTVPSWPRHRGSAPREHRRIGMLQQEDDGRSERASMKRLFKPPGLLRRVEV